MLSPIPSYRKSFTFEHVILELNVPDAAWVEEHYLQQFDEKIPYWTKLWPAAFVLTQWMAEHPETFQYKTWLEVGGGLGLPSIMATLLGTQAYCSDNNMQALQFLKDNITRYDWRKLTPLHYDWQLDETHPAVNGILLADVNYDPNSSRILLDKIKSWKENGLSIYLTTPHRLAGRMFVEQLLELEFDMESLPPHRYSPDVACSLYKLEQK